MTKPWHRAVAIGCVSISTALLIVAPSVAETLRGRKAFGGWRDDAPGVQRHFKLDDLPAPSPEKSSSSRASLKPLADGVKPRVPVGFSVELVASGLAGPRVIRVAPNGDVFIADSKANRVLVMRLGDAKPSLPTVFASGLSRPYGIAFYPPGPEPKWIYVANADSVVRFPYANGDKLASAAAETIVPGIPSTHHWTRDIAFTPDGATMYLTVGSGSNVAEDMAKAPPGGVESWADSRPLGATWGSEERRADLLAFTPDGKDERVVATGLRNCAGLALDPVSGAPWCVVNERDQLGDNVPFEFATRVVEGAFYGWPWYYMGGHPDPRHKGARPDLAGNVATPDVLVQPHSAPLGIAFYPGANFPAEYRGDAFVTLHGSWNRGTPTGYKVVRLLFADGKPTGAYEDFVTGFVGPDGSIWGRPVGVAVAKDGALLISEDGSGTIWRVVHNGG